MRDPRLLLRLAAVIFGLMAAGHLVRFVIGLPVVVGTFAVPHWPSAIAVVVLGALAIVFWRASARAGP